MKGNVVLLLLTMCVLLTNVQFVSFTYIMWNYVPSSMCGVSNIYVHITSKCLSV
jgi:hypothetical protein